jgi:hypothetical protein
MFRRNRLLRSYLLQLDFRRDWMVARDSSRIYPNNSIRSTGFYPACWMGSRKELPRLHPKSFNSG